MRVKLKKKRWGTVVKIEKKKKRKVSKGELINDRDQNRYQLSFFSDKEFIFLFSIDENYSEFLRVEYNLQRNKSVKYNIIQTCFQEGESKQRMCLASFLGETYS